MARELVKHDWKKGEQLTGGWVNTVGGMLTRLANPGRGKKANSGEAPMPGVPHMITVTNDVTDTHDDVNSGLYLAKYRTWNTTDKKWKDHRTGKNSDWLVDVRAWGRQPNDYDWDTKQGLRLAIYDVMWAIWEPTRFAFVPMNPPLERQGKTTGTISPNASGRIDLWQALKPTSGTLKETSRWVEAYHDWMDMGESITAGKECVIRWMQQNGRYSIVEVECES